jgi:hypothetical protein
MQVFTTTSNMATPHSGHDAEKTGTFAPQPSNLATSALRPISTATDHPPNLTDLLTVFICKLARDRRRKPAGNCVRTARIKHLLNRNTVANSQKNIHAHYDPSNAFFTAFRGWTTA